MPASLNLENDYRTFDLTEAVSLGSIVDGAVAATVATANALREPATRQAAVFAAAGLALEPEDTVFHLPAAQVGGVTPKNGDVITDAGGTAWTVLSVRCVSGGSRYECACRVRRV